MKKEQQNLNIMGQATGTYELPEKYAYKNNKQNLNLNNYKK